MDPPPEVPPPPPRDWSLVDEDGPERPAPRGFIHLSVAKELYVFAFFSLYTPFNYLTSCTSAPPLP